MPGVARKQITEQKQGRSQRTIPILCNIYGWLMDCNNKYQYFMDKLRYFSIDSNAKMSMKAMMIIRNGNNFR